MQRPLSNIAVVLIALALGFTADDAFVSGQQSELSGLNQFAPADTLGGQDPAKFSAEFTLQENSRVGTLTIAASIAPGWHIYSLNHPTGGPRPTVITVRESNEFTLLGPFQADSEPRVEFDAIFKMDTFWHEFAASWSAPLELAEGVDPRTVDINIRVTGQVCEVTCLQVSQDLEASFDGYVEADTWTDEFRADLSHVTWKGWLSETIAQPGDTVTLKLEAASDLGWHVYHYGEQVTGSYRPTMIALTKKNGWRSSAPTPSQPPVVSQVGSEKMLVHEDNVIWSIDVHVPREAEPGVYELAGYIGYQTCDQQASCDPPTSAEFKVDFLVGAPRDSQPAVVSFDSGPGYNPVAQYVAEHAASTADGITGADKPIWLWMLIAFTAGLILNVMPCVLPVIGLKVMAFVQQAGENPRRIFTLNLAFALGMMSVFMLLAALAAIANYSWGDLYTLDWFQIAMTAVVFAFGLSFFGVWEIPIPGFVGSGVASKAAEQEGYVGAFAKGILSTLLATPCSGPFLIPAVTWAATQPPWLIFLMFGALGLGMASPYIVIGAAPRLVYMLPKPGPWMETFKQLMGFLMMGTAVFLLNGLDNHLKMPVLALMVAIGLACWIVGRVPLAADWQRKLRALGVAGVIMTIAWIICFYVFVPFYKLDWQPYSRNALENHLAQGHTVFIDFTADW